MQVLVNYQYWNRSNIPKQKEFANESKRYTACMLRTQHLTSTVEIKLVSLKFRLILTPV